MYKKQMEAYVFKCKRLANIQAALTSAKVKEKDRIELTEAYRELEMELGEMPRNPSILADDVTPEALFKLMSETGGTAGIFSDEARVILKMLIGKIYGSTGESREDFLLRPFDGEAPLTRRRISTGTDYIERPCIGMLLMVQTDYLRKIGETGSFFESGLVSRCLFCYPESWVGRRYADGTLMRDDDDYIIPQDIFSKYENLIFNLLDKSYASTEPVYYQLSDDAKVLWREFYREIEGESGLNGRYNETIDFAIRYAPLTSRLALQMAVLNNHQQIELDNMQRGIVLMRYFMTAAERCYQIMKQVQLPDEGKKILVQFNKLNPGATITVRDLENRTGLTREAVEAGLKPLMERNYCRIRIMDKTGAGRKPSGIIEINPEFYSE